MTIRSEVYGDLSAQQIYQLARFVNQYLLDKGLPTSILTGTATYDPPSLGDTAGTTTTVTVTSAALGDPAIATFSLDTQGITITAWVSSANTVSVRFQNESGGTLDIASGTLTAKVLKFT